MNPTVSVYALVAIWLLATALGLHPSKKEPPSNPASNQQTMVNQ